MHDGEEITSRKGGGEGRRNIIIDGIRTDLEKRVPQSHRYSRVPQVLECAFQSDCTA
jgi:hypothetical protein